MGVCDIRVMEGRMCELFFFFLFHKVQMKYINLEMGDRVE